MNDLWVFSLVLKQKKMKYEKLAQKHDTLRIEIELLILLYSVAIAKNTI